MVGHSYGAAVALHAAVLAPGRFTGVVVADGYLPCFEAGLRDRQDVHARHAMARLRDLGVDLPSDLPRIAYGSLADLESALRRSGPGPRR